MEPSITPAMVDAITHEVAHQVKVIPAPVMPEDSEFVEPGFLERLFDALVGRYEWILVDTTDQVRDDTLELLDRAQTAVYVVTPDVTSVRNARRWFDLVKRVGVSTDNIRVLANKVDTEDETSLDFLHKHFGAAMLRCGEPYRPDPATP